MRQVRPAQQRAQAQHQFLDGERLGDVVVAAGGEPGDPVADVVSGGEEQHGHPLDVGAHPPQHLEPVDVGQHHIEHDQVRAELARGRDRGQPVGGGAHLPALVAQGQRHSSDRVCSSSTTSTLIASPVGRAQLGAIGAVGMPDSVAAAWLMSPS